MNDPMRGHIVVGAGPPVTEAGRLWHEEWHSGGYAGAAIAAQCGSMGCGFLGRILAVEAEVGLDVGRLTRALDRAAEGLVEQGITEPNSAIVAAVVAAEY